MTGDSNLREFLSLMTKLPAKKQKYFLRLVRRLAEDKGDSEMDMEYEHNTQDDLADDLWETAQWLAAAETGKLLEFAADKTRKGIGKARKENEWPDGIGWISKYSWLAYLVRMAYLKGYAEGFEGAGVGLNADAALAETLAEDDFGELYFDCEVPPAPAVKFLLRELEQLQDFDT